MAISEIEKLERRYQENPQGLTFAPLAEAYRKSGDPERALALLVPGLELHPDYPPASIVQGRCHLDMRNDAAAELSFAHVLSIDAESVIALKALADIAERATRFSDAERWLLQLLAADRSNDDAKSQLERVQAAKAQSAAADDGSSVPGALEVAAGEVSLVEGLEVEVPVAAEPPVPLEVLPPLPTVERATETARLEDEEPEPAAAVVPISLPVEPFRVDSDASVLDDAILGVMHLGGGDEIILEAAPSTEYQLPSASEDFGKEPALESSEARVSEFQLPSASDDLAELKPSGDVSEYQLPSATDDLALPDLSATAGASEYQLPDASADFTTVPLTGTEGNEFQAPDSSHDLVAQAAARAAETAADNSGREERPEEARPEAAAENSGREERQETAAEHSGQDERSETAEAPPGEWVTWADSALDPDAPPFEEDAPPPWAAVAESLPAYAPEPVAADDVVVAERVDDDLVVAARVDIVDIDDMVGDLEVEPELVVTESMAELFVAQGHPADALRVYRQLLERRPEDERLIERIGLLEIAAAAAEPTPRVAASVSGGTSVREMMRSLLTSRPNGIERAAVPSSAPGSDAPGSPTRPAPDHLTLSAIFGDDASPLPPVMRPPPARPASDRGVTFDEFYGAPAGSSSPGHERTTRLAQSDDDLDQFHDWLQNLKR